MVRLVLLVASLSLLAHVSATFIKFSVGNEPTHSESHSEWIQESHQGDLKANKKWWKHQSHDEHDEGEIKIKKKWSWMPLWPWKKSEKIVEEHHSEISHYPVWKIHKYKGIEVQPIHVIDKDHHENHNYEPSHEQHQTEEWSHHPEWEHHNAEEAVETDLVNSFVGEGHTMDTLHKLWPSFKKDKKVLEKFKKFHTLKSWGGHETSEPISHHHHHQQHQEWHGHHDLHAHGSEHESMIASLPEAPEVNLPGLNHLPIPTMPNLDHKPVYDSYGKLINPGLEVHVPEQLSEKTETEAVAQPEVILQH